jgi:MscS family membrane protein
MSVHPGVDPVLAEPRRRHAPAAPVAVLLLLAAAVSGGIARGQSPPATAAAPSAAAQPRGNGTGRATPRDALTGFLAAGEAGDFAAAARYLDLGKGVARRPQGAPERLARRLYLVLLHFSIDPETISNAPLGSGVAEDGKPVEKVLVAAARGRDLPVVLERVAGEGGEGVWLISAGTVATIDALYRAHGYAWIGDHLPSFFFSWSFLGIQLWQWLSLVIALSLGYALARGIARVLLIALAAVARHTALTWDDALVRALDGPLAVVLWGLTLTTTAAWAGLPTGAAAVSRLVWRLLTLAGIGWLLFRVWDGVVENVRRRADETRPITLGYLPIISRTGKFFIALIVALIGLDVIGINVVAMLAGLGIGGIAIAFAAQKTIENIFGAVTIAGDHPFKVGDFVTAAGATGTVEEIGLRSTRLRTLDRMVVTIPNGLLAAGTIVNLTERDRFLYNPRIGVRYETTADQLTFIVDEIRKALIRHPRVFQDSHRARFAGFGASSLDIEVLAWVLADDFHVFTAIAEELNFAIARIVEQAGTSFAFPSQTLYLGRDAAPGAQRAAEVAAEVAARRERGELAVPEPPPGLAEALRRQNKIEP